MNCIVVVTSSVKIFLQILYKMGELGILRFNLLVYFCTKSHIQIMFSIELFLHIRIFFVTNGYVMENVLYIIPHKVKKKTLINWNDLLQ